MNAANSLVFTKALAALLITNSHFDMLYPDARFAGGGVLGNSLFFFLSGFGICASASARKVGLVEYAYRRLIRIYPSVWLVVLASVAFGAWSFSSDVAGVFRWLIWPTPYWFVSAIVIFYGLCFWLLDRKSTVVVYAIGISVLLYGLCYIWLDHGKFSIEDGYFKWIAYFVIMLLGVLRFKVEFFEIKWPAFVAVVSAILYYFVKYLLLKNGLGSFQFICSLFQILFVVSVFQADICFPWRSDLVVHRGVLYVSGILAAITLEIYLVQVPLLPYLSKYDIAFPLNIAIALSVIVILAWFVVHIQKFAGNAFGSVIRLLRRS